MGVRGGPAAGSRAVTALRSSIAPIRADALNDAALGLLPIGDVRRVPYSPTLEGQYIVKPRLELAGNRKSETSAPGFCA